MPLVSEVNASVGDVGTRIAFNFEDADGAYVNVSGATTLLYRVQKPDGTYATWTGEAGEETYQMEYYTVAGDFSVNGQFALQPYVDSDSWTGHAKEAFYIEVKTPIPAPEA
jgi:hypothetical protein